MKNNIDIDFKRMSKNQILDFIERAKTSNANTEIKEFYINEALTYLTDNKIINQKILNDILEGQAEIDGTVD